MKTKKIIGRSVKTILLLAWWYLVFGIEIIAICGLGLGIIMSIVGLGTCIGLMYLLIKFFLWMEGIE